MSYIFAILSDLPPRIVEIGAEFIRQFPWIIGG